MKTQFWIALVSICTIACSSPLETKLHDDKTTDLDSLATGTELSPDVYLSAIEISEDYDWRRDTAFGAVKSRLVLYKNSQEILSFPAGKGEEVSIDPDMHHLSKGHIYTEFVAPHRSIVKKDGELLYDCNVAEKIISLLEDDKNVFTYCKRFYGDGICWRVNGDVLYENLFGKAVGNMYADLGHICFSYKNLMPDSEERLTLVVDGNEKEYAFPEWLKPIDIRIAGGITYILATEKDGLGGYFMQADQEPIHIIGPSYVICEAHIHYDGLSPIVCGRMRNKTSNFEYGFIWKDGELSRIYSSDEISFYARKGEYAFVRQSREQHIIAHGPAGDMSTGDDPYYFFTDKCAAFNGKELYVILTSTQAGQPPVLWEGDRESTMPMDGYFTGIELVNPSN